MVHFLVAALHFETVILLGNFYSVAFLSTGHRARRIWPLATFLFGGIMKETVYAEKSENMEDKTGHRKRLS